MQQSLWCAVEGAPCIACERVEVPARMGDKQTNSLKQRLCSDGLFRRLLAAMALIACFSGPVWAQSQVPVMTETGPVLPADEPGPVQVYKGIPYAAPPVGELRWRPPKNPAKSDEVLIAEEFGPPCPQGNFPGVSDPRKASEDCLSLNIWTPAQKNGARLPVIVWIHGGAFVAGSNASHDGAALAEKGAVVVAANYRLGPLGFFTHPLLTAESDTGSSGNYALLDLVKALEWVQGNIAGFGGDPNNVTIVGQSAGSEMVNLLIVSPLSKGLFAKAIAESGGSMGWRQPRTLVRSEALGETLARQADASSLEQLRDLSPETLFELGRRDFEPVVDGYSYPTAQREVMRAGEQHPVPMIVGSTADEGQLNSALTAQSYLKDVTDRFGDRADDFLYWFPAGSDEEARISNKRSLTLGTEYIEATIADAQAHLAPTYQYRFVHAPPPPLSDSAYGANRQGAYHAAELPYVFANLHQEPRAWTDVDRMLELAMSSYWLNFARTGDPNGPGLPPWPELNPTTPQVLQFGNEIELVDRPNGEVIRALEQIYYGDEGVFSSAFAQPNKSGGR